MNNRVLGTVDVIAAIRFAAAMLTILWPSGGWAQSGTPVEFKPAIEQKVDARSSPAKVAVEGESALTSKGYVKLGRIRASQPGKEENPEVTKQLESSILQKAAEVGGDVVRFSKEGALVHTNFDTGKTKTKRTCEQSSSQSVSTTTSSTSCYTDIHGFQHCMTTNSPAWRTTYNCVKWGEAKEVPVIKLKEVLISKGVVWRYDPKLAAEVEAEDARLKSVPLSGDLNAQDPEGWTPLTRAVDDENMRKAKLLLAHGADVNAAAADAGTPLNIAARHEDVEMAELLLAHGANPNGKNIDGDTPLHETRSTEIAELLLAHGAEVDARNSGDNTPLNLAAYWGDVPMAEVLLAHGADVNAKNHLDWRYLTPLRTAVMTTESPHPVRVMVRLLQKYGGRTR